MMHTLNAGQTPLLRLGRSVASLAVGAIAGVLTALPGQAAEQITFYYSIFGRSIDISSLELFAEEGIVNNQLGDYFAIADLDETQQAAFRTALRQPAEIDPVLLSRFFYTNLGEEILTRFLGDLIRTEAGLNSKYAIRSALVLAAQDEEGLSVLNFLRYLPTDIRINLESVLSLSESVESVVEATQFAVTTLSTLSSEEAADEPFVAFDSMPALSQPGDVQVEFQRWGLTSERRNPSTGELDERRFYVDVFIPQQMQPGQTPVIVFSHGLSSEPRYYWDWAQHMASHGYLVALPQHPGSDIEQRERVQQGLAVNIFEVTEFVDRPLDISDVIDELERRNSSQFNGQLDLDQVGVAGHSFGGYTALAVAGAVPDFEFLAEECDERFSYLNTSLLLQCQALMLPQQTYNFRDPRVQAIAIINPVNSSIYGPAGLSQVPIPLMVIAGSYDPATPAVFEQFRTFPWFTTSERYLALIEGQAHIDFSEVGAGISETIDSIDGLTLPDPNIVDAYSQALSLAFFEVYVEENEDFRPYLQASYSDFLSRGREFDVHLISAAKNEGLTEAIETFLAQRNLD